MKFKGRTVFAFMLLAMFAGSILTLTMAGPLDTLKGLNASVVATVAGGTETVEGTKPSVRKNGLTDEEVSKLSTVYELLETRYYESVDRKTLIEGAIDGLVQALEDPYSEYLDKKEVESFSEHINSSFSGIGAEVTLQDGQVVIVSPIKNSPAERAGLMAGDIILSVNGEPLQGLELTDAVGKIRGPKGTQAKLNIQRKGSAITMEIVVVRDDISVETVSAEMLENDIGLIDIRQFAVNTGARFAEELAKLERSGMKGLIIDVRNNPGGVVDAVQSIAEQFVPKGKTIMHLEYRDGKRDQTTSNSDGKPYPVVVLINEGSASASEILAAAIQESAGGTLIGKKTFGKGLVQSSVDLHDGSGVKLTIAKWLTPDGDTIHESGVQPDLEVEQPKLFEAVAIPKDKVLAFDMVGDEIRNVQVILEGLGYEPGRTDGYFSEKTKEAVSAFQKDHGLSANGTVNKETATKLEELVVQHYLDPAHDAQLRAAVQHLQKMLAN